MTQVGCKWMAAHLDEYIAGGCTQEERESAALHLAVCVDCFENVQMWSFLKVEVPRAPLPPLSPLAERRILSNRAGEATAGLNNRGARGRAVVPVAAAVAAVVIVALVSFGRTPSSVPAAGAASSSPPEVSRIDENSKRSEARSLKAALDGTIRRDASGRRYIDVAPGTALWLAEGAAVEVDALDDTQARFRLTRGWVVADIGPVPQGFRFVVSTKAREIEARGTVFSVEVNDTGSAGVRVAEGTVEVRDRSRRRETQIIRAGQALAPSDAAPEASASAIIWRAMRSFLEEPGFKNSSLARMRPLMSRVTLVRSINGVLPIASTADGKSSEGVVILKVLILTN